MNKTKIGDTMSMENTEFRTISAEFATNAVFIKHVEHLIEELSSSAEHNVTVSHESTMDGFIFIVNVKVCGDSNSVEKTARVLDGALSQYKVCKHERIHTN